MPVPALILIVAILHFIVKPSLFFEPAWLLPLTNTLFVTVVCFVIAFIAARNYRMSGRGQVLLLGCGVFAFGVAAVLAAFLRSVPGTGANLNVTVYNTGALVAAIFHFIAALILLSGISPETGSKRKGLWAVGTYAGLAVFMALFTTASVRGMVPPFFVQGAGPTLLRQEVLGTADVLFAFSFLIFIGTYLRNRETFLYWYASALALTSISLTGFFMESAIGSPIGWASRFSQYLGGIYFLIAVLSAARGAQARRTSFDTVLTAALSPGEEKFRALSENSPDVITRFDREMRHIYVNAAGIELYGKPARSIIGRTITESGLPDDYCSALKERIERVLETGGPAQIEGYLPAGEATRFYQSRCVPEYGQDGRVANVLVVSRDLTESKSAEEALRQSEERWATTLSSIGDAVIATDAAGSITFMNTIAEHLTGWSCAEAAAKHITEVFNIVNEQTRRQAENPVVKVLREGMIVGLANHTILVRKDGTEVAIDDSGAPIRDKEGNTLGVVLVFRDITDRRKTEERARHLASFPELNPSPVMEVDGAGSVTFCNPGAMKTLEGLGLVREDCECFLPGDLGAILRSWDRKNESTLYREVALNNRVFGETIYLVPQFGVARIYAYDITERKMAEEGLRESEGKYRKLFENMTEEVHFWELALDGEGRIKTWRLVDANPPALKTWGKTLDEVRGKSTDEIFGPGATDHYMPVVRKIMAEGVPYSFEDYFPQLDKHFRFTSVPLGDYFITTGADITSNKKAEQALRELNATLEHRVAERTAEVHKALETVREERQRLYDVLETLPTMICLLTPDYHVAFANRSFRERFGDSEGRHCYEYRIGRTAPCDFCESYKVLETGKPHRWESQPRTAPAL